MDIRLRDVSVQLPVNQNGQRNDQAGDRTRNLFRIQKLDLAAGSRVFIEGPSGIGKSTLLHLIAGLFQPESGSVTIGTHAFHDMSDSARSRIRREHFSLVFQKLNLVEHLTALESVQLGLFKKASPALSSAVMSMAASDPLAALKRVGLADRADERIGLMSLGEQQRVAVARVLAARPQIVLADEPTSSLDAKNAELIVDHLLDVPKESTVVVVSHDQRIRSRFATALQFKDLIS